MKRVKGVLFTLIAAICLSTTVLGQSAGAETGASGSKQKEESKGFSHCVLFYLQSYDQETLPFEDICMVRDKYSLDDYRYIRVFGPVEGSIDLFRTYDWTINFHLPEVDGLGRLTPYVPKDFLNPEQDIPEGKIFVTISDNRERKKFGRQEDRVDFVSVGGRVKITEFRNREGDMKYPYFNLQLDLNMRRVNLEGGGDEIVGPEIRIKGVLLVQEQEN